MSVVVRNRVSAEQLDMLITFMEEHLDFAAGRASVYSRFSSSKLWRLLAERLNAAAADTGGARKSPDKWCRYWADIKYKARRKTGELSAAEERLRTILRWEGAAAPHTARDEEDDVKAGTGGGGAAECGGGAGGEEDACSDTSAPDRVPTEELIAEAAMRTALAAEKQAEAVIQGVEALRELVSLVRAGALGGAGPHAPQHAHAHAHDAPQHAHDAPPPLHHHRL